jgi:hypothetical protein
MQQLPRYLSLSAEQRSATLNDRNWVFLEKPRRPTKFEKGQSLVFLIKTDEDDVTEGYFVFRTAGALLLANIW